MSVVGKEMIKKWIILTFFLAFSGYRINCYLVSIGIALSKSGVIICGPENINLLIVSAHRVVFEQYCKQPR